MKKLLSMLLAALLFVIMMAPGFCLAAEDDSFDSPGEPTRYDLTSSISASISASGHTIKAAGRVSAQYASASCTVRVKLQKKVNGSWTTVKTWTGSGTLSASAGGSYTATSGSYRTCVNATVTYNGQTEYTHKYSGTKTV